MTTENGTVATLTTARTRRVPAAQLPGVEDVRLSPGGPVELLNLSETGGLVETSARFTVGSALTLSLGGSRPRRLSSRVVRCEVCGIHRDNTMSYQVALAFDPAARPQFEELSADPVIPVTDVPVTSAVTGSVVADVEPVNEW